MYHGANYQAAVGAFFSALALAENTNLIPREIPATHPPFRVGAEQGWAVDDVAVWFRTDSIAWIQAKASLDASGLRDVIDQMVRQVVHGRDRTLGTPLQRDDRLLLAVGDAPRWIEVDLRTLLLRLGSLEAEDEILAALQEPGPVKEAYDRVAPLVRLALTAEDQIADDATVRRVLAFARVWPISEDELHRNTTILLDQYVVESSEMVPAAVAVLRQHFSEAAQNRTIHNVCELRAVLAATGLRLRAPRSTAVDVEVLVEETDRVVSTESAVRALRTREGTIYLARAATQDVIRALRQGSLAVVGEAGAGKSAMLLAVAANLRKIGENVVFIDATDPAMRDPQSAFGLTMKLNNVLRSWGDQPAFLLIDGLDATRLGESYDSLLRVLRELQVQAGNWRAAITSRDYDLMYAPELRDILPYDAARGVPELLRNVERFGHVEHVFLRGLDDSELSALSARSPSLGALIAAAPDDVQHLLRNPFNLSVAARLTIDSETVPDLSSVRDRVDLLDLWWERRLNRDPALPKERLLMAVAQRMIAERRLRVSVDVIGNDSAAAAALFSEAVLVPLGRRGRQLAYTHAIIFDYVVDRLLLDSPGAIAALLGDDRDAFLFLLPSIRMRFAELWRDDRANFYRELAVLFAEHKQRRTLLMVAASIPVDSLEHSDDLLPLLDATDTASIAAVKFVVRTLIYQREQGRTFVGEAAKQWADVALEMARRLPRHEHDALLLLLELLRAENIEAAQFAVIGEAARLCLSQQLDRVPYDARFIRMAIEAFMKSYDADPEEARPLLNRMLHPERIAQLGQFEIEPLATNVDRLHDATALEAIFAGVFADVTLPDRKIAMGNPSAIMNFVQDANQTLSHARWALGQRFAAFLDEEPRAAIRAFCYVIQRQASDPHASQWLEVRYRDIDLHLLRDFSNVWDSEIHHHDDWYIISSAFETRLRDGLAAGDSFFETALEEIARNGRALYLWRILMRNAGATDASSLAVVQFVAQPSVLLTLELGLPISSYLADAYVRLPQNSQEAIDSALLSVIDDEQDDELRSYREKRVAEFAASIPSGSILTERLAQMVSTEVETTTDEALYRRTMTLSGGFMHEATMSRPSIGEAAEAVGATPELIGAIEEAQGIFDAGHNVQAQRDSGAVGPAVRKIDANSLNAAEAIRSAALDVIAALVRIGLEWEAFDSDDRAEFLPLILEAVRTEEDAADVGAAESTDDSDDGFMSFGSPNALADGTRALWRFYRFEHDDRIVAAIYRLARHPRSNIRFLAVQQAGLLRDINAEAVWVIAERAVGDATTGVVSAGLATANMVQHLDFERFRRLMFSAYDRFVFTKPKTDFTRNLLQWVIWRAQLMDAEASERLEVVLAAPWSYADVAGTVIFLLANGLVSTVSLEDRTRTSSILTRLVERLTNRVEELIERCSFSIDAYPEPDKVDALASLRLLTEAAERIYYSSGVIQRKGNGPFEDTGIIDGDQFLVLNPALQLLARIPFSKTSFYVIKTLYGAIEADPRGTLLLGIDAVRSGAIGGIVNDGMAEGDVREFVRRYVDCHRGLLESQGEYLAGIMDIVDLFVDAGWPRWIDVIFNLDYIYRGD